MAEEKKEEGSKKPDEDSTQNAGVSGDKEEKNDKKESGTAPIQEAKDILAKIEEQNKILTENLKRAEKAGADLMLAGRAPAGKEKTAEDEREESARKLLKGTGLEEHAGFKPESK